MDLFTGLRSGRESLMTHGAALAASSDNISNTSTTGYKGNRPEFADLMSGGNSGVFGPMVGQTTGSGVAIDKISADMTSGAIEDTGRSLDAAIVGRGFYVLQGNNSEQLYSRAGNFSANSEGILVSADGFPVLGFTSASPTAPTTLNIANVASTAAPTTSVLMNGNLDAAAENVTVPAAGATAAQLAAATSFAIPVPIIDSLGQERDVSVRFFKTANRTWTAQAYVDGAEVGGTAGTPTAIGTPTTLSFDENGKLAAGGASTLTLNAPWANGAAASTTAIDLSGFSQYASGSYVSSLTGDGSKAGILVGTEITNEGVVNAVLDNGGRVAVGTLALANFPNEGALIRIGDNNFRAPEEAGEVAIGNPRTAGRGEIKGSALEGSNVDLSSEFIKVIQYQRAYQAGSQVVQTMSGLLDATIQIA